MRFLSSLLLAPSLLLGLATQGVSAANAFSGSNLYYAAGLTQAQRTTLFNGLQSAGMKVLRVWLDGQSGSPKGTPINAFPSLEPNQICNGNAACYDDTVLNRLDQFMVEARAHGIKLIISMHSFNSLAGGDVYGKIYGTGFFYEQSTPIQAFDQRLRHVMNHNHTTLGKPWRLLNDYIFGFEAQNEAMIGKGEQYIRDHTYWQCDRAKTIRSVLGSNRGILVMTGGESWLSESVQDAWLDCAELDVISIHAYGPGDYNTGTLQGYVNKAKAKGKKLIMQEWGACYFNTENNNCPTGGMLSTATRNNNIKNWAAQITNAGLGWLYWQVIPNNDPHFGADFEVGIGEPSWPTLQAAAQAANNAPGAFDFSAYLP